MGERFVYVLAMLGAVCLSAASQMLLKKAARITWPNALREYLNVWVIGGYGLLVGGRCCVLCGRLGGVSLGGFGSGLSSGCCGRGGCICRSGLGKGASGGEAEHDCGKFHGFHFYSFKRIG